MKKIYTKDEFEKLLKTNASNMVKDKELTKNALDIKVKAGYE